jgi:hypothetical protein
LLTEESGHYTPLKAGGIAVPDRITLSRTKGWKMPENTVKVDRSTAWGNPYQAGQDRDDPDWRADYSRNYVDRGKSKWLNLAGGCGFHGDRFHVMRRIGKKAAGRLLDGREHNDMPGVM